MNLQEFISEYGQFVKSYKSYDNGIIRIKFSNPDKIMWLKRIIREEMGMKVKTANVGKTYWFEPIE